MIFNRQISVQVNLIISIKKGEQNDQLIQYFKNAWLGVIWKSKACVNKSLKLRGFFCYESV